jgi:pimeloyl-ACP methyl ester carboxylesterase
MLVVGVVGILGVLWINNRIALRRELSRYPAPGERVPVGDTVLHMDCRGDGEPAVIIDAANAEFGLVWRPIQQALAETTTVCTYDRAGYGWSDPSDAPRHAAQVVDELHALLAARDGGPVVLVGHSLGGLHALLYAATYPDDVAGLVLVDAPSPQTILRAGLVPHQQQLGYYRAMRFLTGSGLLRVLGPIMGEGALPEAAARLPEIRDEYLLLTLQPHLYDTAIAEIEAMEISARQVAAALEGEAPLGDLPILVLSAGARADAGSPRDVTLTQDQGWQAQLSTRGEQRIIDDAGHRVNLDTPEAVVQAVRDVLALARGGAEDTGSTD